MTPEKQRQKLAGQTSIAQKVFQFVPVGEAWTPQQIAQALHRTTGSRIDPQILKGCLMTMVDAGLLKHRHNAEFQRIPATDKELQPMSTPKPPEAKKEPASAIDLLAGIAKSLRSIAGEIETAALAIEEGQAKSTEEVQKLRQLQALLKGLA